MVPISDAEIDRVVTGGVAAFVRLPAGLTHHPGALEYTRSGVTRTAARRSSAITRS